MSTPSDPLPTRPEVTVVIPTRNRWLLLRRTLKGALGQQGVDIEVVVVDDASTDETPQRLAEVADPRLRVVSHEARQGVTRARNAGIRAARGEWVAFLDDDDLWSPQKLRIQLRAAHERDADFVYGAVVWVDRDLRVIESHRPAPDPAGLVKELLRRNAVPGGCSNPVANASVLRRLGGFDERLYQLADWDMWLRLALATRAAACPDVLVAYLVHPENMLLSESQDVRDELQQFLLKHRSSYQALDTEVDGVMFNRWVAWGYWRRRHRLRGICVYLDGLRRYWNSQDALRSLRSFVRRARMKIWPGKVSEPEWLALYR